MVKNNVFPISLFIFVIGGFYGWTSYFEGNLLLVATGINVLEILVGMAGIFWIFQAYRGAIPRQRSFWVLLLTGLIIYIAANWIWLYDQLFRGSPDFSDASYLIWMMGYLFFLAALIAKAIELRKESPGPSYIFNITVFMITVIAVCFQYLINPAVDVPGTTWISVATAVVYPIIDLSIILIATILYYQMLKDRKRDWLLILVAAFFLQITADFLFAYAGFNGSYEQGHLIDLLWLLSTMYIGLAGYFGKMGDTKDVWLLKNPVRGQEETFPYYSILVLLVMVANSYDFDFNALSLGLLLTFFLVLGRQLHIQQKNRHLMNEYRYLAYHDPLTNLRNRGSFVEEIECVLTENSTRETALLLIDLDQFKVINDTLGHHVGDKVLEQTAARLQTVIEDNMLLFRMGGDEFVIVIIGDTDNQSVATAENLLALFRESMPIDEYEVDVTPSIGISKFPNHGHTAEELMKNADAAMYLSKENGKNGYSIFNAEMSQDNVRKMTIEIELKKAISKKQLQLYYQPKVDLRNNKTIGMEALLRWQHPSLGWVSPDEFIPVAEETGQIVSIGEWVLREACRQNRAWQDMGFPPLTVSVNVSVLQFRHSDFLGTVQQILDETALDSQYLELEITESIMQNIKESIIILDGLHQMGIKASIDDFGTGYSSLHVLQKLPIDTLKIDKSFVDELDADPLNPMVKAIVDLGLNLNMTLVAEGIESENQVNVLLGHGCTIGQGYLFSKPVTATDFEELMAARLGQLK
ncbi:putative bifunctional diguanylate cyclase/phosphodiesterase [Planococcus beigongshangi]|uniref:putative bifunctional diguanylate cyclase/phosphodiesterase n=1 Tax=Planococcus beigongshangi TaxID=2782536 RepID=UPI001EEEBC63|nr:EAL domain-containing protein [Planococcus beigongshangi]